MTDNLIETHDLTKIYKLKGKNKQIKALDKVNLSVEKGEIFGLLGPNGAGKTTMISILTTLLQPSSGYALVDGYNILKEPKKAKANLALMLGSDMLYYRITGYKNLKFFCKIYRVEDYEEKIYEMAKQFELDNWLNQYVEKYSSGMKMKLALCRTFLTERDILFLDEPTVGLDVKSVSFIVDRIKNTDKTIFLTSHDMNVVDKLCNRIAFINKGKIIKIGTKDDISRLIQAEIKFEVEIKENKNELIKELKSSNFVKDITDEDPNIIVSLNNRDSINNLLLTLGKYKIIRIKELEMSLEDLFLHLYDTTPDTP